MTELDWSKVLADIMALVEASQPFIEAAKAYKDRLIAEGFSETASEQMAVDFHRRMYQMMVES